MKIILAGLIGAFLISGEVHAVAKHKSTAAEADTDSGTPVVARGGRGRRDRASRAGADYTFLMQNAIEGKVFMPSKQKGKADPKDFTENAINAAAAPKVTKYFETLLALRTKLETCPGDASKKLLAFMDKVIKNLKEKVEAGIVDNTCGSDAVFPDATARHDRRVEKCTVDVAAQMFLTTQVVGYLTKTGMPTPELTQVKEGYEAMFKSGWNLDLPADQQWAENALFAPGSPFVSEKEELLKLKNLNVDDQKCVIWPPAGPTPSATPTSGGTPAPSTRPSLGPSASPAPSTTPAGSGTPVPVNTLPLGSGETKTSPAPVVSPSANPGGGSPVGSADTGGPAANAGGVGDNVAGNIGDRQQIDPNDLLNQLARFAQQPPVFEAPRTNDADRSAQGGDRTENPPQPPVFPPQQPLADQGKDDDDDNEQPFVPGDEGNKSNGLDPALLMAMMQNQNQQRQPNPEPVVQGPAQFDPRLLSMFANRDRDENTNDASMNAFTAAITNRLNALEARGAVAQGTVATNAFGAKVGPIPARRGPVLGSTLRTSRRRVGSSTPLGINSATRAAGTGMRKPLGSGL